MAKLVMRHTVLLLFVLALVSGPAHAFGKKKRLKESDVEAFIIQTASIMSGQEDTMSKKDILKYLDKHLEKNARFKSTLNYNIPGHPPQETAMSFGKKAFIENVKEGKQSINDFQSTVEIMEISITSDKKQAMIKTRSLEEGFMDVPVDEMTTEKVPFEGEALCDQIITMNKKGVIQMFSANCRTNINFSEY